MLLPIKLNWWHPQIQLDFLAPLERGTRTVALWPFGSSPFGSLLLFSPICLLPTTDSLSLEQPLSVWLCTAWLLHLRNHTSEAAAAAQPHPQSGHLGSCRWSWSWGHHPEILTRQKQSRPRTRSKWIMAAGVIINERSPQTGISMRCLDSATGQKKETRKGLRTIG